MTGPDASDTGAFARPGSDPPPFPMPHTASGGQKLPKLTSEERRRYVDRLNRYIAEHPNYVESFNRLPPHLVNRAWA
jgi:hypothetical protein